MEVVPLPPGSDAIQAWWRHKLVLTAAAKDTRDSLFMKLDPATSKQSLAMRLTTVARMVWRQDFNLFHRLRSRDPIFEQYLVDDGASLSLRDPDAFAIDITAAKIRKFDFQVKELRELGPNPLPARRRRSGG